MDEKQVLYCAIVESAERFSAVKEHGKHIVVTKHGDKFWVVNEPEGWVPATSTHVSDDDNIPHDVKIWNTYEDAENFLKEWKGHPWWCSTIAYKIIRIEKTFKTVHFGYKKIE